jgi:hypothetical protein
MTEESPRLRRILLRLAAERGDGRTFCPSEAARRLDPEDWRLHLAAVRSATVELVREGRLAAFQRGIEVDPVNARGPIRLGLR